MVIYSKKDRVLNVESNYQKSCHFFNIILYKTSDMIFGMELLSKGNKIGSVYQGRCVCVCVLGEGSEWKGASWEGGSTKEDQ